MTTRPRSRSNDNDIGEVSETTPESGFDVEISASPSPALQVHADNSLRAWLQALGCFILFFNVWGYPSAWGSFQEYYTSDYLPQSSPASISWIGSTQTTLLVFLGLLWGPIFDLGYYKTLMYSGASISAVGALALSFSNKYWQVFLTQGLCIGLGCGVLFIPTLALVTRSFKKRRAFAVALVFCGTPIGM